MHTDKTPNKARQPASRALLATFAFASCCLLGCQSNAPHAVITLDRSEIPSARNGTDRPNLVPRPATNEVNYRKGSIRIDTVKADDPVASSWRSTYEVPAPQSNNLLSTNSVIAKYDVVILEAIEKRWFELLDKRQYAGEQWGRVVIHFKLHHDGSVSDVVFVGSQVDLALGMLCQSAIKDPAPFPHWPDELRKSVKEGGRDMTITFRY